MSAESDPQGRALSAAREGRLTDDLLAAVAPETALLLRVWWAVQQGDEAAAVALTAGDHEVGVGAARSRLPERTSIGGSELVERFDRYLVE